MNKKITFQEKIKLSQEMTRNFQIKKTNFSIISVKENLMKNISIILSSDIDIAP